MNCPKCGQRTLPSLSNCPHCNAFLGGQSNHGFQFAKSTHRSNSTDPSGTPNSPQNQLNPQFQQSSFGQFQTGGSKQQQQIVQISGKTFLLLAGGFGLLAATLWLVVPFYHKSMGHEAHYMVRWCTNTSHGAGSGTSPDEILAQGFQPENRMAPGYSRLGDEPMHRVRCFSKDYGQERPTYRSINNHREYRAVATYFAEPEQTMTPPANRPSSNF